MTVEEAKNTIAEMREKLLYGCWFMSGLGPEKVAAACNGCGPASWPEERRRKLGKWLKTFKLAFDSHDCRFTYDNDGSRERFDYANEELLKNCRLLADLEYKRFNPVRYFARNRAHIIFILCQNFGWSAYQDAYNKQKQGETK